MENITEERLRWCQQDLTGQANLGLSLLSLDNPALLVRFTDYWIPAAPMSRLSEDVSARSAVVHPSFNPPQPPTPIMHCSSLFWLVLVHVALQQNRKRRHSRLHRQPPLARTSCFGKPGFLFTISGRKCLRTWIFVPALVLLSAHHWLYSAVADTCALETTLVWTALVP